MSSRTEGGSTFGILPGSLREQHNANRPHKKGGPEKKQSGMSPVTGGQQSGGGNVEAVKRSSASQEVVALTMTGGGPRMPEKWQRGDSIGTGSFGSVFLGMNQMTGELLAVKEVAVNAEAHKMKDAVEQLESEVRVLGTLNHPNIVKYVGTLRESRRLYIFLEYVPGGSIATLLQRFGPLAESVIRVYTRQILKGLAYLHASRTVHRDIKGANLLVEKNGRIKLADFGMAKQMVEHMSVTRSFKGSAFWMAPEVIRQRGHGVAADIWSVGCTILEMATGKPPWSHCFTQVQAIFQIASSSDLPTIPETLSPLAAEFIMLCLQRDPNARPTAVDLLKHPFVALKPGEEEHPTYVSSDEYCSVGVVSSTATVSATATVRQAPQFSTSPSKGQLPNVEEGNEADALRSAFSYNGGGAGATANRRRAAASSTARQPNQSTGERAQTESAVDFPAASAGRPPPAPASVLSPGTPAGTTPNKTKKKQKSHRSSHGSSNSGDENATSSTKPSATTRLSESSPVISGQSTPTTPVVGEDDDQELGSQPQQFRVKGFLGLPPLKLHANTGGAHLALPALEHRSTSAVSTPSKAVPQ
eukprot:CAMPEP_0177767512 /NCGR_PEP_ID=MMETSP0491_2-20121128/9158_1 /TAXON_ID=63592 /ORGANISM="Tetraselmis chuii, Strain PLY429" /LENGTH=586 /DNA_ID=CAMNT_0019284119 /DNA_START=1087 /DNA_END=2847 /DNA_ORIENTATION=-